MLALWTPTMWQMCSSNSHIIALTNDPICGASWFGRAATKMSFAHTLQHVYLDHSTYAPPPSRFEPGTPAIAEAIGLGAAVDYLEDLGMQNVHNFEHDLGGYLHDRVRSLSCLWKLVTPLSTVAEVHAWLKALAGCAFMNEV